MTTRDGHGGASADDSGLAPVTYLPGVTPERAAPRRAAGLPDRPRKAVAFSEEYWADGELADTSEQPRDSHAGARDAAPGLDEIDDPVAARESVIEQARTDLTRSLGRRGLSVAEARARLRTHGLVDDESVAVIDDFSQRGWLDDAVLAEQLVHSAVTRKDMGTRAVRQLLVKRLIDRQVVDAVIAELPDDDEERAQEFAATKARALTRYDDETATRRLMGMLARRGFGGAVAGKAARAALAEARGQAGGSGVRFR